MKASDRVLVNQIDSMLADVALMEGEGRLRHFTVRLAVLAIDELTRVAKKLNTTKTDIVREALSAWFAAYYARERAALAAAGAAGLDDEAAEQVRAMVVELPDSELEEGEGLRFRVDDGTGPQGRDQVIMVRERDGAEFMLFEQHAVRLVTEADRVVMTFFRLGREVDRRTTPLPQLA